MLQTERLCNPFDLRQSQKFGRFRPRMPGRKDLRTHDSLVGQQAKESHLRDAAESGHRRRLVFPIRLGGLVMGVRLGDKCQPDVNV